MKNWIKKNLKNIVATAFVVPILLVAYVSISHVTTFYGLSNPFSWAVYLSIAIEIAALSALAAVSVRMGKFVYVPFIIVTLIQFVGNLYFSFTFINENSESFKEWMNMVGGIFEPMGVDPTDVIAHKRILSFFSGGLLPIISLTFAHMLVVFTEGIKDNKESLQIEESKQIVNNPEISEEELNRISREAGKIEYEDSLKEKQGNFGDLNEIEKYLLQLKPVEKSIDSEPVESIKEDVVPEVVEEVKDEVITEQEVNQPTEEISDVEPIDENNAGQQNDNIKRLVYSARNG